MELTDQEIDLIFKGLDAIAGAEVGADLFSGLMTGIAARGDPEFLRKAKQERIDFEQEQKASRRIRDERIIMLKAKLLSMRQGAAADKFMNES